MKQLSNAEKIRRQKNTICSPDSKCICMEGPKFQWGKCSVDTEGEKKNLNVRDDRVLKEIPWGSCGFCHCLSLTRGYINFYRLWHILIVCLEALNFFQLQFQILWFFYHFATNTSLQITHMLLFNWVNPALSALYSLIHRTTRLCGIMFYHFMCFNILCVIMFFCSKWSKKGMQRCNLETP